MKFSVVSILTLTSIISCTAFKKDQALRSEGLLQKSGFQTIEIDFKSLKQMPQQQLFETKVNNQFVYRYADAEFCVCLLQGDQYAYQRYVDMIETLNAEAVPGTDPEQEAENMRAMPFFTR